MLLISKSTQLLYAEGQNTYPSGFNAGMFIPTNLYSVAGSRSSLPVSEKLAYAGVFLKAISLKPLWLNEKLKASGTEITQSVYSTGMSVCAYHESI